MARRCLRCGHKIEEGRPGASIGTCGPCYQILSDRLDQSLQAHPSDTQIFAYFEGQLDEREAYAVSDHLSECERCHHGFIGHTIA
jgi:hypothetical protein